MYLVYDYHRVPLERDESTTCSITLPPELYDTSEQAAPGAWMLLEANFAIASTRPCCRSDSTRHQQARQAIIPPNAPHTDTAVP